MKSSLTLIFLLSIFLFAPSLQKGKKYYYSEDYVSPAPEAVEPKSSN